MTSVPGLNAPLRIGVVGANSEVGWAAVSHLPALSALPEYEIRAVGTTRAESANVCARTYGAAHAFTDVEALARQPDVDLVAVVVNVAHHDELVRAAVRAGKPVVCEWPLGRTTTEAEGTLAATEAAGVRSFIALQAWADAALSHVRHLVADGYVGRVLSVTATSTVGTWGGARIPDWTRRTLDPTLGIDLIGVAVAHTLEGLLTLTGTHPDAVDDLAVHLSTQHPDVEIIETGEIVHVSAADHIVMGATLDGGAALSLAMHRGTARGSRNVVDVAGTEGDLRLESTEQPATGLQRSALRLTGGRGGEPTLAEIAVPRADDLPEGLPLSAVNVALAYRQIARDLLDGTTVAPDFAHAMAMHRLLDRIRDAGATPADYLAR